MKDIFSPGGFLDMELSEYEYRESQLVMAEFIYERLFEGENGIVEAGTGTGKTMAYLIPALKFALENDFKIAITTETKALQKQLVDKDIAAVQKIFKNHLGIDFKFALALGSYNYPCRRKFERLLKKGGFDRNDMTYLNRLSSLFKEKRIFTFFDVEMPGYLWEEIGRDSDICGYQKCLMSSICPFQAARREWAQADLLIMNHYLFFTNVASGRTYLPVFDGVIFDEAHSVESIASKQLGFSIDYDFLINLLQKFYQKGKYSIINNFKDNKLREDAILSVELIVKDAQIFFENVRNLFQGLETVQRITAPSVDGEKLVSEIKKLISILDVVKDDFEDDDLRMELDPAMNKLIAYCESLISFLNLSYENYVYWIERSDKELLGNISLVGRPINIDNIMKHEVFSFYKSSIFVSATLSIKNDFSFFMSVIGFENGKGIVLESPFNFNEQMVIYLAGDMPAPDDEDYPLAVANTSSEIIELLNGNCLLLFTSYSMLKKVKVLLEEKIDNKIYSQDSMSASKALDFYINDDSSILMGTHSFWQGIDLPGDLLKGVIIARLPFAVPDTPIMEAKFEKLRNDGKNPFVNLQIPEAVLKMRQGAGRLIRRGTDRGVVAILDSRIKTKGYGAIFSDSLPECERSFSLKEFTKKYKALMDVTDN
ncbi:MAG: ATP-dependent DNA helicase [Spirochaetes bacterium]|nr:ATP-dependent DNA helicase [Spirochaetota bacterium]